MRTRRYRSWLLGAVVLFGALAVLVFAGWQAALDRYAGGWRHQPEDAAWILSDTAQALVDETFADLDAPIVDQRIDVISDARLAGPVTDKSAQAGVEAAPSMSPLVWFRRKAVRDAAGMGDGVFADAEYVSRLLRQIRAMPGAYRGLIFARDAVYDAQGQRDDAATTDFVANAYVVWLAERAPQRLVPVVSVHPARSDADAALAHWADQGVTQVSWRPVAQHIELDSPTTEDVYAVMVDRGMTLHTQVGYWESAHGQARTIDPWALVPALEAGLDVRVAIGDIDRSADIDVMAALFALLRKPAYAKHLTIELGGVLSAGRLDSVLTPLLQHPQFFKHIRYASGYPVCALAHAIDPERLADRDFIDRALVAPLRAIYDVNPLLFALVTLRNARLPTTGLGFPASVFTGENAS